MLVLNRRAGESIVIEPDICVTVRSVTEQRVWIEIASSSMPAFGVSAWGLSESEARMEIRPVASVTFDAGAVRVSTAPPDHPASACRAGLTVTRPLGTRVHVGTDAWVSVTAMAMGNPCLHFGGPALGAGELGVTLIRPARSYVRLGVEAPGRRVFREELWSASQEARAAVPSIPGIPVPGVSVGTTAR